MWLKDDRCEDVVHLAWDRCLEGDAMGKVLGKVANCQTQLKLWDKSTFGNIRIELPRKRKQLLKVESESMGGRGHTWVKVLTDEIQNLMDKEEVMWHQRAKNDWLKFGDQNTKYFHCHVTKRNKMNFISGLENEQGSWVEGEDQIRALLTRYYTSLFTSGNPTQLDSVLNVVETRVSAEMNAELLKPFVKVEVQLALKQMDANTAPGPDGLPPLFYK